MRMKFVALSLATLLVVVAWFFLGFKPSSARLKEVKDQVETTRTEIAALEARLAHLQELKRNEKQLREEEARLKKGLPGVPAVSDFIRQVQNAANDAGIDFLTITPTVPAPLEGATAAAPAPATSPAPAASPSAAGAPAPAAPAPTAQLYGIGVTIDADGRFFAIEGLVSRLERLERATRINSFTLSKQSDDADPVLGLAIQMQVYMTPAPAGTTTGS